MPSCTTIGIAAAAAALDEALDVPVTFPGIDDHLLALELIRQQRLGLVQLQVGPDEHGLVRRAPPGGGCLPLLDHEAVVAPARRPIDRQSEADRALALKVVRRVAKFEPLVNDGLSQQIFGARMDSKGFDGILVEGLRRPLRLDALAGVEAEDARGHTPDAGYANQGAGGDRGEAGEGRGEAGEDHVFVMSSLLYGQHGDVIACNFDLRYVMRMSRSLC